MNLYETFKDVYVGDLTEQETRELAKFASALVSAKAEENVEKTAALLKHAASEITEYEDFEAISNLFVGIKNNTPGLEKFASVDRVGKNIDIALKGGLLASAIAPIFVGMYKRNQQRRNHDRVFNQILSENPDLAKSHTYEETKRNFDTLKQFSPDVASNALVSGNVLQRMNRLGPSLMDINMVNELASTQKDISDRRKKDFEIAPRTSAQAIDSATRDLTGAISTQLPTREQTNLNNLKSQTETLQAGIANIEARAKWQNLQDNK